MTPGAILLSTKVWAEDLRSPLASLSITKEQEQIFSSQGTGFVDALI